MISPTCAAELCAAPNWQELAAEYAEECRLDGLPLAAIRFETYDALERAGFLHLFKATVDGMLVGLISVLSVPNPHYGKVICSTESFFVSKPYRSTGSGVKLLMAAEGKAREIGSPGLFVSAPFHGSLWEVLPRMGYREANRSFFKPVGGMDA